MTDARTSEGRPPAVLLAAMLIIAIVAILLLGIAGFLAPAQTQPPASPTPSTVPTGVTGPVPQVAPLAACTLLTVDEIDVALGIAELPQRGYFETSGHEACTWTHQDSEGNRDAQIRILPGELDDFASDADLNGLGSEAVHGVGMLAVWFPTDSGGTLSVVDMGDLGYVLMRLAVFRPDLDGQARRDLAAGLAIMVLPRFPGILTPVVEPEVITIAHEAPDLSAESLVENLLAKEGDGEWTLGEGLVASLQLLTGAPEAPGVLRHAELAEIDATGIIEMATEFVDAQPDAPLAGEIRDLLDRLTYTNEELESMAGIGLLTASLSGGGPPMTAQESKDCQDFFGGNEPGIGACLAYKTTTIDGKAFRVFYPAPPLPSAGWTEHHYDLAIEAFSESVPKLSPYGAIPATNLVFSVLGSRYAYTVYRPGEPCAIAVDTKAQTFDDADIKQIIAHELGHCFNRETFGAQGAVAYKWRKWWDEGLADYLSNVAYKENNLEDRTWKKLAGLELATALFDRTYANEIFFQHLENRDGISGVIDRVKGFATTNGREAQEEALAATREAQTVIQTFVEQLTDAKVRDTNNDLIEYAAMADDLSISGRQVVVDNPLPFGASRLHLTVPDGQYACIKYPTPKGSLQVRWRPGAVGRDQIGGEWSDDLPSVLSGEAVFVVTTISAGAEFVLDVTEVSDESDCQEHETPAPSICPICGPSAFYRLFEQLPSWFVTMLGS